MVNQKKKEAVKKYTQLIADYKTIGLLDMHKLPGRQLHNIRNTIRQDAKILMIKKRLLRLIFEQLKKENLVNLLDIIQGQPALLLSNSDVFRLARTIDASKAPAKAKEGDIAQKDIVVPAGPTPLPPGPAIGDLQKIKLPAMVQGDKIAVRQDTIVARKGDAVNRDVANVLMKLGIEPMEIGLNMVAAWDDGIIFSRDLLFVPLSSYESDVALANLHAFNLTMKIVYITPQNVPHLLAKANRDAMGVAVEAWVLDSGTVTPLIGRACRQAAALSARILRHPQAPSGVNAQQVSTQ
jgi:large subunit ribosomal protein L10